MNTQSHGNPMQPPAQSINPGSATGRMSAIIKLTVVAAIFLVSLLVEYMSPSMNLPR